MKNRLIKSAPLALFWVFPVLICTIFMGCQSSRASEITFEQADAVLAPWSGDVPDKDIAWRQEKDLDYMPVIYSGFSWHNLYKTRNQSAQLDAIPRSGGRFLWEHGRTVKASGTNMVYVAMFDEMNEGTQIFKVTDNPPVGESPFLTYGDLPTDHYLWLTGHIRALMRGDMEYTKKLPSRN